MKAVAAILLMTAVLTFIGCKKSGDNDVRVTTYTPQDITQATAKCGGDVIVTQGLSLSALGVCWGTSLNPTVEDFHLSTTNWSEPYVCTIYGLEPNTTYHVRAYALRGLEYYYGDDKSFTTEVNSVWVSHDFVDLCLPSGTLWSTCNVGADLPEEYGDYFAWGETEAKSVYDWSTYKWGNGDRFQLAKYCNSSSYGYSGFTDNLTTLLPEDDAAMANWGNGWCMPSHEQWEELFQNTTTTWTTQNGVSGRLFTASNGNVLFLPAAGRRSATELHHAGSFGDYWSNSLYTDIPSYAWGLYFISGDAYVDVYYSRYYGLPVRPVRKN